jgi:hypothetical protein
MMKKIILVCLLQIVWVSTISAQVWKGVEIKGGVLMAQPALKIYNTIYETQPKAGWQIGLTKNIPVYKALMMEVGTGYSKSQLIAKESISNGNSLDRPVSFSYTFLETGVNFRPKLGLFSPYIGSSFRFGGLTGSNMETQLFLMKDSYKPYDYGLNFRAGISYKMGSYEPFIETNFYQGLANVGEVKGVQIQDKDGVIRNKIIHQFLGFQVGLKF